MAYLFLLLTFQSFSQPEVLNYQPFSQKEQIAYNCAMKLQLSRARISLKTISAKERTPYYYYIENTIDMAELIISENSDFYSAYEANSSKRIEILNELNNSNPLKLLLQGEIKLHTAFVKLKFGEEFNGAWNIRSAYRLLTKNEELFPGFLLNNKPLGLLHVMIGSVPDNYKWITNLLNLRGTVNQGIAELSVQINEENPFKLEAMVMYHIMESYVLFNKLKSIETVKIIYKENPDNLLINYLLASILLKSHKSEEALFVLNKFELKPDIHVDFPFLNYLRGEIYLQKGNYPKARQSFELFLAKFKGKNFIKDVYYKLFLSFWLDNKEYEAKKYFSLANNNGRELAEVDKSASKSIQRGFPNKEIMKIRLLTDGGYFDSALNKVDSFDTLGLKNEMEKVEFQYRLARLNHEMNNLSKAIPYYKSTINQSPKDSHWYFAPNSALMLGYIYKSAGDYIAAEKYLKMAMSFKNHDYENSISSKAKTALEEIIEK